MIYIYPIYIKRHAHTECIFCMNSVCPPLHGWDLSASHNRVMEESAPSQVASTLPSSPCLTLLIFFLCLGSGAVQIAGVGRSRSAGYNTWHLCHSMGVTQGCLAVWRRHPWALALVEPRCYRWMVQTPQEYLTECKA